MLDPIENLKKSVDTVKKEVRAVPGKSKNSFKIPRWLLKSFTVFSIVMLGLTIIVFILGFIINKAWLTGLGLFLFFPFLLINLFILIFYLISRSMKKELGKE